MKKILGLTIAALLVIGLVGGATWAYFSDTETSTGNSFVAGTLDLGLYNSDNSSSTGSVTGTFSALDWAPGDTDNGTIYVNNNGSLNSSVNITLTYSITDGTPHTVYNYAGTNTTDDISKMIKITTATFGTGNHIAALEGETLDDLQTTGSISLGALNADTQVPMFIVWTFDSTASNGCQGDNITVTLKFDSIQS